MLHLTVSSIVDLTPCVKQFELVSDTGAVLPRVEGGAHIDVLTGNGVFRSYSLVNWGEDHRYVIAVELAPGSTAGSQFMHDFVDVGDTLPVRLSPNGFPLSSEAGPALLIAGGIGVTPILCLARELVARHGEFEFHYCGKDLRQMAYCEEIRSEFGERARFHVSSDGSRLDLSNLLTRRPDGAHLYICGPRRLIEAARAAAEHWPVDSVHFELFINASADAGRIASPAEPFEIELARSGTVLQVSSTETILDVLLRQGIAVPRACVSGWCGTCAVPLLAGQADHRDKVLSEAERSNRIQTCCSRALPGQRLVLGR